MQNIKAAVVTLGCRVNQCESDAIMRELSKKGVLICGHEDICDIYIINTCCVTAESERKSRQLIRRCISENPEAVIIVTGCYSQINTETVSKIDGVDFICGNNGKSAIPDKAIELFNNKKSIAPFIPDIYSGYFDTMSAGAPFARTRAFVKIEDGCESKCSYCIIPLARGSVRSDAPEKIIEEVKNIVSEGCKEVVLTGIETASYGKDFKDGYSLSDLLCEINDIEGIKRIRLGSLDPSAINKAFTDKIKTLDKLMPHFHVSLQSGSAKILRLMRRKYNIETALENIDYLRNCIPSVMLTADIITGFPTETDEDFEQTLDFFRNNRFLRIHIFPYSKRAGTFAAEMEGQTAEKVKKERLHKLAELEKKVRTEILKDFVKSHNEVEVLFESFDGKYITGHTPNFIEMKVQYSKSLSGMFVKVKPVFSDSEYIYGEII